MSKISKTGQLRGIKDSWYFLRFPVLYNASAKDRFALESKKQLSQEQMDQVYERRIKFELKTRGLVNLSDATMVRTEFSATIFKPKILFFDFEFFTSM